MSKAYFRLLKDFAIGAHFYAEGQVICPSELPYPQLTDEVCREEPKKGRPRVFAEISAAEAGAEPPPDPGAGAIDPPPDPDVRMFQIKQAAEGLDKADPNVWTQAGAPKVSIIEEIVGFKVSAAEIKGAAPDVHNQQ